MPFQPTMPKTAGKAQATWRLLRSPDWPAVHDTLGAAVVIWNEIEGPFGQPWSTGRQLLTDFRPPFRVTILEPPLER
jgi:hypothetical protein